MRGPLLLLPFVLALAGCSTIASDFGFLPAAQQAPANAIVAAAQPVALGGAPMSIVAAPVATPTVIPTTLIQSNSPGFISSDAVLDISPEAGTVTAVRERDYVNGTRQEIVLQTPQGSRADNVMEFAVGTVLNVNGARADVLPMYRPSERGIKGEIIGRFSGMQMHIVTRPMGNSFGPFGLAVGLDSNGGRCIFAWQWIDDVGALQGDQSGFSKIASLAGGGRASASIRIRLCRKDQTVDQLAAYVEGLAISNPANLQRILNKDRQIARPDLQPVAAMTPVTTTSNGVFADVVASTGPLETALGGPALGSANVVSARPARVRSAPVRVASRRTTRRVARSAPVEKQPEAVAIAPVVSNGIRYMAPVNTPGPAAAAMPATQAANAWPSRALDQSLPPQAYRGPGRSLSPQGNRPQGIPGYGG